jgi:porphobilinogen synthase
MFKRFRSSRINEETRLKNRETFLHPKDFILPIFLVEGKNIKQEITSMPEVYHFSVDKLLIELEPLINNGLQSVLLFPVPEKKGIEQAWSDSGIIQTALPLIKNKFPKLEIITDVCLCAFTEDGHCHIGDNDKTCQILSKIALSHAKAGADIVAPSDMMDGRIFFIKNSLKENNLNQTKILSYAAKYASNFYGPFRDATDCAPKTGDRKTYQMDYANSNEAMLEIATDIEEGANQIMIKPAMAYLDIIANAKHNFSIHLVAYNVSGEYRMIKDAIEKGYAKEDLIIETLTSIKRAGANKIVSYFTPYILNKGSI